MNNSNIKFGICQWSLPIEGPYACKIAADLGLEGIGLNFLKDIKFEPFAKKCVQQAFIEAGEEWGITFPSLAVNYLCNFGMSKSKNIDLIKRALEKAVEVAINMKIGIVQLPSFADGIITNEEELLQTIEVLKFACEISKNEGIIIGTENALSWEENLRILGEVGYDNLKIYFDTQNPYVVNGYNSAEMVEKFGQLICEVHAKDGANGKMGAALLGEGQSGFFETVKSLKKINYSRWIHLENDYVSNPLNFAGEHHIESIKRDVRTLKEAFI